MPRRQDRFGYGTSIPPTTARVSWAVLHDQASNKLGRVNAEVRRLRSLSEAVQATYPGWPMSVRWTWGLQITALTPLLGGLVSVVLKFVEGD